MFVKRKLLIVDDDVEILRLLKVKFDATGRFNVVLADGGQAAVQKIREVMPDLVVCDIDMPEFDGGAVASQVAEDETTRAVPFIFLSSMVSPTDAVKDDIGGWPMISKRTPFQKLLERIDAILDAGPGVTKV